jgi:hypothetical protein
MDTKPRWGTGLKIAGGLLMVLGSVDPMEGSAFILGGSVVLAAGMWVAGETGAALRYWFGVSGLIAVGVAALWGLSSIGGIGGGSGRSWWWGLLLVPYPVGWFLAVGGAIARGVRHLRSRRQLAGI